MSEFSRQSDSREPKTSEELQIIMAKAISDLPGSIFVPPDAIEIGPNDNADGNWWYGYDHDANFSQFIKNNRVIISKFQREFRLVPWVKSPRISINTISPD